MDCVAGSSLFPLHRCKTIHLVRHAQGIHNVEGDKNYNAYINPDYFDAHLTPLGWQQVDNLRKHVRDSGLINTIDLVIASPMMRTLQTAVGVFGGEAYTDKTDVLPLMVANAGNSYRAAISSLNSPPVVAVELCREHLLDSDEDTWWKANVRETKEELAARGLKFLNCFANCELRSMVIVDRSMIGSELSTTNYPGKIPSGLDLPSDVADEKSEK
ncbi:Phosphoglycerate mutase-like protein 1 [Glycine soja]